MELCIEQEFLNHFFMEVDDKKPSAEEEIFINMLKEYGDKIVVTDSDSQIEKEYDNEEKLKLLIDKNPFWEYVFDTSFLKTTGSIQKYLMNDSEFSQTLVFMHSNHDWFEEAENKGALCFSFENYKDKIHSLKKKIEFKLDLNEGFPGWKILNKFNEMPLSKIIIKDPFILSNGDGQKIEDNIIPLLKTIIPEKFHKIKVETFSKEFPLQKKFEDKPSIITKVVGELFKTIKKALKQSNVNHKIYSLRYENDYRYHDRFIITNFYIIECSNGFNLMPSKDGDSKLEGYSIFDKFYYKRMNNLEKRLKTYKSKLNSVENGFKYFPDHF